MNFSSSLRYPPWNCSDSLCGHKTWRGVNDRTSLTVSFISDNVGNRRFWTPGYKNFCARADLTGFHTLLHGLNNPKGYKKGIPSRFICSILSSSKKISFRLLIIRLMARLEVSQSLVLSFPLGAMISSLTIALSKYGSRLTNSCMQHGLPVFFKGLTQPFHRGKWFMIVSVTTESSFDPLLLTSSIRLYSVPPKVSTL